jgi:phytoene dehydrogenase-like protein
MAQYDAVVVGAGLGGLTAGAILAREGRKVLVIERGNSVGGAASSYKVGDLFVEGSLHVTGDPHHARDPKHRALTRAGALDAVQWIPAQALYEVRGGPLGAQPFVLPDNFAGAREALHARFPQACRAIDRLLDEMRLLASTLGERGLGGVLALAAQFPDWESSLADKLQALFGDDEAVKCAVAGNLSYIHDDAAALWWVPFAVVQGSFLASGARFVQGGSQRLSSALARVIKNAGGEVLLRRLVTRVEKDTATDTHRVTHAARGGDDPQTVETSTVISGAAPAALAELMPKAQAKRLGESYANRAPSLSLFALTLGLSKPPREFGFTSYSTQLLPDWMTSLSQYADGKTLMAGEPAGRIPPLAIADYSAIESGVPAPPFVLSAVGPDRISNWDERDPDAYRARRGRWQQAIIDHLDSRFPGLGVAVTAASFNSALSVQQYLNLPGGMAYGFAPTRPASATDPYRSPRTVLDGLYLASAFAGIGGYSGVVQAAEACADMILDRRDA